MSRYARRAPIRTLGADRNAGTLKDFAERCGLTVDPLAGGNGRPDWLVGGWGVTALAEVKPERSTAGGVFARETNLRKSQVAWASVWRGAKPFLVRTTDDVAEMANTMREWARRMGK